MKIQNLSIIFLIIIIPLIMILSYYLELEEETLELQAEYDTKLAEATREGIKAFEINTVDWSEWVSEKTSVTEREDAKSAINTFITSLANSLNISGTAKEFMVNYIPVVTVTMYDGYYVYAPNYVPISITNEYNEPLYYDETTNEITTKDRDGKNKPIYEPKDGVETEFATYITDNNTTKTENISFVTNMDKAQMEYKHILSSQIAYTERYSKANTNVVVNYTLDNRMYVYGTVNGEYMQKDGYLVYFKSDTVMPRIRIKQNAQKDTDIIVIDGVDKAVYYNDEIKVKIDGEILEEQVVYLEDGEYKLGTFKYIYDIENNKLYYDEEKQDFFEFLDKKYRVFINETNYGNVRYKSVSVLLGNGETVAYKKLYQALNGKHKGQWYINLKEDSEESKKEGKEEIDTRIKEVKLKELGLTEDISTLEICKDYSAISYYVEAYAFTNWTRQNLKGVKVYNSETKNYENIMVEGNIENIFDITSSNDPEKETSPIVIHKEEIMKKNIITNLNLAISNYSRGEYEYKLPELTERDWQQVFNNISIITFFQGIQIGLKTYNNYAIATSTVNREYVDPEEIYLSGADENYHIAYCEKCGNVDYTGYRSAEYALKEYSISDSENIYYYQHDNQQDEYSETACYYCIVNKENYNQTQNKEIQEKQTKAYNEALARERYYQKEMINEKVGITITYDYNIAGWDDIIDKSGLPEEQEIGIGEYATISTSKPSIVSNDQFVRYVFVGWTDNPNSTDIKYMPGDEDIFYVDTKLYAIWRISLADLPWKLDYLWDSATDGFETGTCRC